MTMSIDKDIEQALKQEAKQLDQILAHEPGIFTMLLNAYKGALGGWLILVGVVTFIITILLVWAGYQFFFETLTFEDKMTWGVILLLSVFAQGMLKMWTFMEMNRQSTNREIKRLELAIEKLTNQLIK